MSVVHVWTQQLDAVLCRADDSLGTTHHTTTTHPGSLPSRTLLLQQCLHTQPGSLPSRTLLLHQCRGQHTQRGQLENTLLGLRSVCKGQAVVSSVPARRFVVESEGKPSVSVRSTVVKALTRSLPSSWGGRVLSLKTLECYRDVKSHPLRAGKGGGWVWRGGGVAGVCSCALVTPLQPSCLTGTPVVSRGLQLSHGTRAIVSQALTNKRQ